MRQLALTKAAVITPFHLIEEATILISGQKIIAVGPFDEVSIPDGFREIQLDGLIVAPGFVDIHLHGGGGAAVTEGMITNLADVAKFHVTHGTTAFLATTIPGKPEQLSKLAHAFHTLTTAGYKGARCLGLHLEGPHLPPEGSSGKKSLRAPSFDELMEIHRIGGNGIKMVTLAPELDGVLKLGTALVKEGIKCSIGHSDADCDKVMKAVAAGFSCVTDCFGQIHSFHPRNPGVLGVALTSPELFVELVADGVLLHQINVDLAWRTKGVEKIILVSDALPPTGMPDGIYETPEGEMTLVKGELRDRNGNISGGAMTLETGVKNMVKFTSCKLTDAFRMATYNPARFIGVNRRKGSIYPGKDADLTVLTTDLDVIMTMVEGEIVSGLIALDV